MRTLLLCSRPPWPLTGGDRIRTWHLARTLSQLGPVDVVATRRAEEDPQVIREGLPFVDGLELPALDPPSLLLRSADALVRGRALQQAVYESQGARRAVARLLRERPPDVVVAHLVRTLPWIPEVSPPLVVDLQDAISDQYLQSRGHRSGWRGLAMGLEEGRVARAEQDALRRADAVSFISARDRDLLAQPGGPESVIAGPALDFERLEPRGIEPVPGRIGFLGNLRTASNRDMVTYFARRILPLVRSVHREAELHIMGYEAPSSVRRLGRIAGVRFVGPVDDQVPALEACWLTVCPLRFGSGVQNKVLESLALRTPVVATPQVVESLGPRAESGVEARELDRPFAEGVIDLLASPRLRAQRAEAGQTWVREDFRPERALAPLVDVVQRLALDSSPS